MNYSIRAVSYTHLHGVDDVLHCSKSYYRQKRVLYIICSLKVIIEGKNRREERLNNIQQIRRGEIIDIISKRKFVCKLKTWLLERANARGYLESMLFVIVVGNVEGERDSQESDRTCCNITVYCLFVCDTIM